MWEKLSQNKLGSIFSIYLLDNQPHYTLSALLKPMFTELSFDVSSYLQSTKELGLEKTCSVLAIRDT